MLRIKSAAGFVLLLLLLPPLVGAQGLPESPASPNKDVEALVRAEFADIPLMISIAQCESEMRQYGPPGKGANGALHGGAGGAMVGVFQIHEGVHRAAAKAKGMDIDTLEGNIAYARYLFQTEGTNPWLSSASCWQSTAMTISSVVDPGSIVVPGDVAEHKIYTFNSRTLTAALKIGDTKPEVITLQKMLNGSGFVLAESGPGSPGNETSTFGPLTRAAVRTLQCHSKIICSGDEKTTGFGFVGPRTRAALMQFAKDNVYVQPEPIIVTVPLDGQAGSSSTSTASTTPPGSSGSPTSMTPEKAAQIDLLQAQIHELQHRIAELMDT
ncbi:MAG: hypothetical protein G01um10148_998 [Parcubacteria group bacterium Gr01-1014_8]|nr:MAG: hypothetical protein G01um10148_998 [Parcubacteria group bacterium Gr01-1014_8]